MMEIRRKLLLAKLEKGLFNSILKFPYFNANSSVQIEQENMDVDFRARLKKVYVFLLAKGLEDIKFRYQLRSWTKNLAHLLNFSDVLPENSIVLICFCKIHLI